MTGSRAPACSRAAHTKAPAESVDACWSAPALMPPRLRQEAADAGIAVCQKIRQLGSLRLEPGLASGWSGLALLFEHADRCRPEEGWAGEARDALSRAARSIAAQPNRLPPGLSAGWAGVGFVSNYLSRGGQRYRAWRRELGPRLERACLDAATKVEGAQEGWAFADFDQISGVTGVIAGLLGKDPSGSFGSVARALSEGTLRRPSQPPWGTPSALLPDSMVKDQYPRGVVNLGLAHGLAGVVAALALDVLEGGGGVDEKLALVVAADTLASAVQECDGSPTLPHLLPIGEPNNAEGPGRSAWCYGPPGAARALSLAGAVLGRPELIRLANDLLVASIARPARIACLDTPTFCHGIAGVLQIAARMAEDTADTRVAAQVPQLCARLLSFYDPTSVLGFRALGPGGMQDNEAGFLSGAAGIGLVLLSVSHWPDPGWDRAVLLS
jgi:lantibiotic biosynthesis protein